MTLLPCHFIQVDGTARLSLHPLAAWITRFGFRLMEYASHPKHNEEKTGDRDGKRDPANEDEREQIAGEHQSDANRCDANTLESLNSRSCNDRLHRNRLRVLRIESAGLKLLGDRTHNRTASGELRCSLLRVASYVVANLSCRAGL